MLLHPHHKVSLATWETISVQSTAYPSNTELHFEICLNRSAKYMVGKISHRKQPRCIKWNFPLPSSSLIHHCHVSPCRLDHLGSSRDIKFAFQNLTCKRFEDCLEWSIEAYWINLASNEGPIFRLHHERFWNCKRSDTRMHHEVTSIGKLLHDFLYPALNFLLWTYHQSSFRASVTFYSHSLIRWNQVDLFIRLVCHGYVVGIGPWNK